MKNLVFCIIFLLVLWSPLTSSTEVVIWREDADSVVLDRVTVQKIFTKKVTRWPDGRSINVFTKPLNSIEHRDFVTTVLRISLFYFQQQLEEQTYSGKAPSVTEVTDDNVMIRKIESTPGGIGYVNYVLYKGNKQVVVIDLVGGL